MSLAGAAGVAAILGVAGQGFIFNYARDQYELKVTALSEVIERLKVHLDRLQELRAEIPGFWDDETAQMTAQDLDKTIDHVVRAMGQCQDMTLVMKKAIDEFSGSKDRLAEAIQGAMGVLDSVD